MNNTQLRISTEIFEEYIQSTNIKEFFLNQSKMDTIDEVTLKRLIVSIMENETDKIKNTPLNIDEAKVNKENMEYLLEDYTEDNFKNTFDLFLNNVANYTIKEIHHILNSLK